MRFAKHAGLCESLFTYRFIRIESSATRSRSHESAHQGAKASDMSLFTEALIDPEPYVICEWAGLSGITHANNNSKVTRLFVKVDRFIEFSLGGFTACFSP